MKLRQSLGFVSLTLIISTSLAHAADKPKTTVVDCASKSLAAEIDKLDRSSLNLLEFTGECAEPILIEGHRNLTLIGVDGGTISGAYVTDGSAPSTTALEVRDSRVMLQDVTLNSGQYGLLCTDRSTCILRDVTVQGGYDGLAAQNQSAVDILGSSQILDSAGLGVAAYGASSINMRPNWDAGFDPAEPGPVVSGHSGGVWVQDGSFFRSDNVTIASNSFGVQAQRDAVIKMFVSYDSVNGEYFVPGAGVNNNAAHGIRVQLNSTAQIGLPITSNGGAGIRLGALSYLQNAGLYFESNGGVNVSCEDVTAVSNFCPNLGQAIADLQAQVAALQAAANATLAEKVAGKTYAVRTTGHGVGGFNPVEQEVPFVLQNPQRDFSAAEGTLVLAEDGTFSLDLSLTIIPTGIFLQESGNIGGFYQEIELPITDSGTWEVDAGTNEIVFSTGSRLQASPSGEILTTMATELRLQEGDPAIVGFFNTFIADAIYIQQP